MSVSLILQDENKKTLGGYLWVFLTFSTVFSLHFNEFSFSDLNSITSFISVYILLASSLSLAFITIRPEHLLSRLIFRNRRVSPHYETNSKLPIDSILQTPYIASERDNFWGNFFIGIGFLIAIFLPLDRIVGSNILLGLEISKIFGCSIIALIILWNWYYNQKKELRERIEITWRYMEIISQLGWKEYYNEQTRDIEESIKLRLWKKAKYHILELDEAYKKDLAAISQYMEELKDSFHFLLGKQEYLSTFLKFNYADLEKHINKARILGMEYHFSNQFKTLSDRINEYISIRNAFNEASNKLGERIASLIDDIMKSETMGVKRDHFQRLFYAFDNNLFHVDSYEVESSEFIKVKNFALESREKELIELFKGFSSTKDFFLNLTKNYREEYEAEVKKVLESSFLSLNFHSGIDQSISEVKDTLNRFLKLA